MKLRDIFKIDQKGKDRKVGVEVQDKKGNKKVLLTPSGKGMKYANELKGGFKITNEWQVKTDKDGNIPELTREERAYRSGYLDSQKDNAKAYNYKKKK